MKEYELSNMCIPEYPEFSVGKMNGELRNDKAISQYLPDYYERAASRSRLLSQTCVLDLPGTDLWSYLSRPQT